jgi:hypothetical protein
MCTFASRLRGGSDDNEGGCEEGRQIGCAAKVEHGIQREATGLVSVFISYAAVHQRQRLLL